MHNVRSSSDRRVRRRLPLSATAHEARAALLAACAALLLAALGGCTAPARSAPPAGEVVTASEPRLIGPHVTEAAVVRVDGFNGPEYREVWYRYRAMLEGGSARVTSSGALELLEGTLFVDSHREWRKLSVEEAQKKAAWAVAKPAPPGTTRPPDVLLATEAPASSATTPNPSASDLWDLLALQIVNQPSSIAAQPRALWWYPIVVSDPTQQGTVGTNFIVQRAVDASGNATSRVFLRPPVHRPFAKPARVWLASASDPNAQSWAEKDTGVAWLLGTEVYAESVRGQQGVETRILPVDDALAKTLAEIDARARQLGVR